MQVSESFTNLRYFTLEGVKSSDLLAHIPVGIEHLEIRKMRDLAIEGLKEFLYRESKLKSLEIETRCTRNIEVFHTLVEFFTSEHKLKKLLIFFGRYYLITEKLEAPKSNNNNCKFIIFKH